MPETICAKRNRTSWSPPEPLFYNAKFYNANRMADLSDFTFEPDLSRAATLPARWYTDPAILALERERIFARTWQAAGHADWVAEPGTWFGCDVAGEPVLVTRAQDGRLRAMSNV